MISLPILLCVIFPIVYGIYFTACKYQHVKVPEIPDNIREPLALCVNVIFAAIVAGLVGYASFRSFTE